MIIKETKKIETHNQPYIESDKLEAIFRDFKKKSEPKVILAIEDDKSALPAWLAWLKQRAFWIRNAQVEQTAHVVDADTGAVKMRLRLRRDVESGMDQTAVLVPGGSMLIVLKSPVQFDDRGFRVSACSTMECYDVPARKPWRWVIGPPLGLAAMVVACRWWRGRRKVALLKQGRPPADNSSSTV